MDVVSSLNFALDLSDAFLLLSFLTARDALRACISRAFSASRSALTTGCSGSRTSSSDSELELSDDESAG